MTATPDPTSMLLTARRVAAQEREPLAVEMALRIIARVPVDDGPALRDFAARYLKGWEATAEGINEAVGVLRTTIAKRAIQCVMAELPAGKD